MAIYVEHGVADIGVVGKDILMESKAEVIEFLDLHMGVCRLAVAARTDFEEDFSARCGSPQNIRRSPVSFIKG